MARSCRYLRFRPRMHPKARIRAVPAAGAAPRARLGSGLAIALFLSTLFAVSTILLLIRSWLIDAPASEADAMLILGVGGITWLTSLGYYALWQLDKRDISPAKRESQQTRND